MADASKSSGGVVILGVQGSGKTVFLSVLGETFAEGGVFGLSLAGDPATEDFTAETFRLMEWERQFPESTDRTVAMPLHWTVHVGDSELFSLSTLDCAGELIVDAFAPGAEKREALENGAESEDENAFAEASRGSSSRKTAVDRLREMVRDAKVVCLFVNPNDFKQNQRLDGSRQQRDAAFRRYRDMDRLLDVFLRGDAAGSRPIVIVLTQTGSESLRSEIAYHGGPGGYLFDSYRKLRKLSRATSAHVICVSAVNEEVQTGERKWEDDQGQTHFEPVMGPAPAFTSSGMVDFLLAVGGEVSPELAPLGKCLCAMREAESRLAQTRFGGRGAKERVEAAAALETAWKAYDEAVADFMKRHSDIGRFEDDLSATERHCAAEKAAASRLFFAEPVIDRALREAAYADRKLVETEDAEQFGREIADRVNDILPAAAAPVSADVLFPATGWLRAQVEDFRNRQIFARDDFNRALASKHLELAEKALAEAGKWFAPDCAEIAAWPAKIDKLAAELKRTDDFASIDGFLKEAAGAMEVEAPVMAGKSIDMAVALLDELAANEETWGDAAEIKSREKQVRDLSDRRDALAKELDARALKARKWRFQKDLHALFEQSRNNVNADDFDAVEQDIAKIRELADDEPWPEAKKDSVAVIEKIHAHVAARKARRRKMRIITAACVAVALFACWLFLRGSIVSGFKTNVAKARACARNGDFVGASMLLSHVTDVPGLMISRSAHVPPFLEQMVQLGIDDNGALAAESKAVSSIFADLKERFKEAEMNHTGSLAPTQWKNAQKALDNAVGATPNPMLGEFGLPAGRTAYDSAMAGYKEARRLAATAGHELDRAISIAENARNEEKRRQEIEDLRKDIRKISPVQGWRAMANSIPDDLNEWLDLPDDKLKEKWNSVLRASLREGKTIKDVEWDKVIKAFENFDAKASESEKEEFSKEFEGVGKIMRTASAIQVEQERRANFWKELDAIGKRIGEEDSSAIAPRLKNLEDGIRLMEGEKASLQELRDKLTAADVASIQNDVGKNWRAALKKLEAYGHLPAEAEKNRTKAREAIAKAAAAEVKAASSPAAVMKVLTDSAGIKDVIVVSEIDKALMQYVLTTCPATKIPSEEPDWEELGGLYNCLKTSGGRRNEAAQQIVAAFKAWRKSWLDEAQTFADKAEYAKSVSGKVDNSLAVESRLVKVLRGEKALQLWGESRSRALKCRDRLPPLLRVSAYERAYDGGIKYVNTEDSIISPPVNYYVGDDNPETYGRDVIIAMPRGGVTFLAFKDDEDKRFLQDLSGNRAASTAADGVLGAITFDWNGVRHIEVDVGGNAQKSLETPLDNLLAAQDDKVDKADEVDLKEILGF